MCCNCWEKYGSDKIVNSKVIHLLNAIELVYNYGMAGDNLHIVIDDSNIENEHIIFCLDYIIKCENETQKQVELDCFKWLLMCNLAERNSALGIRNGCFFVCVNCLKEICRVNSIWMHKEISNQIHPIKLL